MSKKYDLAVYIGRFSPFHLGHLHTVQQALQLANRVLILVGSSFQPATPKNPWSFNERESMIRRSLPDYDFTNHIMVEPLVDYRYDDTKWVSEVQRTVGDYHPESVVLVGHDKDESSYYLDMFPQWDFVDTGSHDILDATRVRELLFAGEHAFLRSVVTNSVFDYLVGTWKRDTTKFEAIKKEHDYIRGYKAMWPAKIYTTTDVVCVQSGHVLMIERGRDVGVGLLALPGGFLEEGERLVDGAIRELQEETQIKVPEKVLRGSIRAQHVFDAPGRDLRGRIITHGFLIKLDDSQPLPKVKGSDDAKKAWWFPISDLYKNRERVYGDHLDIVDKLTSFI